MAFFMQIRFAEPRYGLRHSNDQEFFQPTKTNATKPRHSTRNTSDQTHFAIVFLPKVYYPHINKDEQKGKKQ